MHLRQDTEGLEYETCAMKDGGVAEARTPSIVRFIGTIAGNCAWISMLMRTDFQRVWGEGVGAGPGRTAWGVGCGVCKSARVGQEQRATSKCLQLLAPFATLSTAFPSAPLFPVACRVVIGRSRCCWLAAHAAPTSLLRGRLVVIPRRFARRLALGLARGPACWGCCAAISSTRVDAWGGRR